MNPNLGKSTVLFGNAKDHVKHSILNILRFKVGSLPVSYLGVPLITKQIGFTDWKSLIEKVQVKVNNWKNRMLSYAGRLQLIASVLASMQVYWPLFLSYQKQWLKTLTRFSKVSYGVGVNSKEARLKCQGNRSASLSVKVGLG